MLKIVSKHDPSDTQTEKQEVEEDNFKPTSSFYILWRLSCNSLAVTGKWCVTFMASQEFPAKITELKLFQTDFSVKVRHELVKERSGCQLILIHLIKDSKFRRSESCGWTAFWSVESNAERRSWSLCFLFNEYFWPFYVFIRYRWQEMRGIRDREWQISPGRCNIANHGRCLNPPETVVVIKIFERTGTPRFILRNLSHKKMTPETWRWAAVEAVRFSSCWNKLKHVCTWVIGPASVFHLRKLATHCV